MPNLTSHPIFRTDHYAGSPVEKIARSLALGPRYYLRDVPRYWSERSARAGLGRDFEVLWNPLHEFGLLGANAIEAPPGMAEVLDRLHEAGLTITLKPGRFLGICSQWWAAAQGEAAVLECGSYRGTTGLALALLGKQHQFRQEIHLFDLFGAPASISFLPIDGPRQSNEFSMEADYPEQLRALAETLGVADRIEIHAGLFSDTFPRFSKPVRPCRFAHVDSNLYLSTKEACQFLLPLLAENARIVFDDYHGVTDLGARLAIDETFGRTYGEIERLSGSSAILQFRRPAM